ncbi:DUF4136 domain-containing protein [Variovorax sp. M-6]|uniref:DUF4136 domain-containing protein n=1 Tax=Variovorax sp. M-6 TaxID=3233041 RepID=UPI003F9B9D6C
MIGRFAALAFALLLSACASVGGPAVKIDVDPAANFSGVRTYSWVARPDGGTPLMQQRIVDGIDSRLQARGWKLAPNGDIHVSAHVTASEKENLKSYYTRVGYLGWGGFGPPAPNSAMPAETFEVGTLVVDMVNAQTKRSAWRGTASGTVQEDPAKMNALLQAALDKMFAAFPPGSK